METKAKIAVCGRCRGRGYLCTECGKPIPQCRCPAGVLMHPCGQCGAGKIHKSVPRGLRLSPYRPPQTMHN